MVPAGNRAKRLSSVNHTTKAIHHGTFNVDIVTHFIPYIKFLECYSPDISLPRSNATSFCPLSPIEVKANSPCQKKKESYHLKTLPAHEITPPSSPLSPSKSMRYTNPVFFNPVTLIQITASGISKSPQMTFLLVRSSLI